MSERQETEAAKNQAVRWRERAGEYEAALTEMRERAEKAEKARAVLDNALDHAYATADEWEQRLRARIDRAEAERDRAEKARIEAFDQCLAAREERDEARATIAAVKKLLDEWFDTEGVYARPRRRLLVQISALLDPPEGGDDG